VKFRIPITSVSDPYPGKNETEKDSASKTSTTSNTKSYIATRDGATARIRKAIVTGYFANAAQLQPNGKS
jgi:hypothetical protein